MKFTSTQENLSKGLSLVAHIASKNTTLPILNNVRIQADKGTIRLSTTNLEMGITCLIRGRVDQEGAYTVQARLMSDFVNLISTDTVDVELRDDALHIQSEKSQTKMKGNADDEFPLIPNVQDANPFTCKAADLSEAIGQVLFAVSHSETRPEISGVFMKFENGSLIMAATDSYRLAEKSIKCNGVESRTVIVPSRALGELQRMLGALGGAEQNDDQMVTIAFQDNQVSFTYNDVELVSRLIEGNYPAYQQIIPNSYETQVIIDRAELLKAVKTASLFSRLGVFDVVVECTAAGVTVSATNAQLGQSTTTIDAALEGKDNSIVLNYKFMMDGLNQMDSTAIVFQMNEGGSPCALRPAETLDGAQTVAKQDYLYIIMPIKQ